MALYHSPSLGDCFWSKGYVIYAATTVVTQNLRECYCAGKHSNSLWRPGKQTGWSESGHGLHWVLTCLWEDSNNFIWNSWNLTQAAPLLKHLSVDHSTGAEPNCKSKTLLSWQLPQGGAEQSYKAHRMELSTSTQVTGKQAMVSTLPFALNQLIIYLKHSPF